MARIPMGNFGNAMPQVERTQMPQRNTGQLAQAVKNLGDSFYARAEQKDKQLQEQEVSAKRLELYHNALDEQEAKVKLDDVMTTEMSEQVTLLKNDVSNGAMTADAGVSTMIPTGTSSANGMFSFRISSLTSSINCFVSKISDNMVTIGIMIASFP